MARWRCTVCNYVYDEDKEGLLFSDLPKDWICPICSAPRSAFVMIGGPSPGEVTSGKTVSDKLLEQLSELGVTYVYGIPGDSNLPLVDALRKQDRIKFMLTRHEETAAFMASAHAKLTGELGACLSIAGPGATNLITGLIDAATDRAPVLALVGQVSQAFLGSEHLQEIDEIELFGQFAVFSETLASPVQTMNLAMLAAKNAYVNRGVAMLSLPTDVLAMGLDDAVLKREEHIIRQALVPADGEFEKAVKLINASKRPMVLGGWGIRGHGKKVLEFAGKISAPVATTSRAKGVIPETHWLSVGVLGAIGTPYAARAITGADLVIVLGSGFRQRNLVPDVSIVQVDVDAVNLGRSFPIKAGLTGDAGLVVEKLTGLVGKKTPDAGYHGDIEKIRQQHLDEISRDAKNMAVPIYPGFVVQSIKKHASGEAIICVDTGDHTYWFYRNYVCDGEETLMSANMASMAFALPAALAAQIDFPGRQVICVTGDGGFGMLMADFTTAVFNDLPIKVVVFNDGKIKNIKKEQLMYGYEEFGTDFVNPNFAEFASSCGGDGYRVEKPEELDGAIKKAFESDKPALVDVVVDPDTTTPVIKKVDVD